MIVCKICNQEFKSIINWKHLKTHGVTTAQYRSQYGDTVSEEFRKLKSKQNSGNSNPNYGNKMSATSRKKISEANRGKAPYNKNKRMCKDQKQLLSEKAIERNRVWHETGSHPIVGKQRSQETKNKIKKQRANQTITKEQTTKAVETKRKNGYDFASFKGKSHTAETKLKIRDSSKKTADLKRSSSLKRAAARLVEHGYTLENFNNSVITIRCNSCSNVFSRSRQYATSSKITDKMCNVCYPPETGTSHQERALAEFLSNHVNIETNNRTLIPPKEIDIYVPDHRLAIEYNGLYWHSEVYKDKNYHQNKKDLAKSKGINLIHIFEDEWQNHPEIVKSRLMMQLGILKNRLYARKCTVKEIDPKTANMFLKENHIQGSGRSNVRVGLYYNQNLVSVMTFLKGDISKGVSDWELNRFCSVLNTQVVGAAGRMFKWFTEKHKPDKIISFSDRRWETGDSVYSKIGFVYESHTAPNYWYVPNNEIHRYHRYSLRKPVGSKLSERALRESQGYLRIYDCGSSKWVWTKEKAE